MRRQELIDELLLNITGEEAAEIINQLSRMAELDGISVHEVTFIKPFVGRASSRDGECKILLEDSLSLVQRAWVFAHEIGHFCTISDFLSPGEEIDLIFGDDKELIARVEQAADKWAYDYIHPPWKKRNNMSNQLCMLDCS